MRHGWFLDKLMMSCYSYMVRQKNIKELTSSTDTLVKVKEVIWVPMRFDLH